MPGVEPTEPIEPILVPEMFELYKNGGVFNAAAIYLDGNFNFLFRGTDIGGHEDYGMYQNFIGHTKSPDLKNWQHHPEPVLTGKCSFEARGPEDLRVVCIEEDDGTFYGIYTGFGGRWPGDISICLASSRDLIKWKKYGVLLPGERNKNSSLLPKKINGEYVLFHRRGVDIWISYAKELGDFRKNKIKSWKILSPIPGKWDGKRIGIAGPPVAHPEGWFLPYHGVDQNSIYRLGAALLDLERPHIVLARQEEWILQPELPWEINGFVRNIIFSCATINWREFVVVPYAGADRVTHVAYIKKDKIIFEEKDRIINCLT